METIEAPKLYTVRELDQHYFDGIRKTLYHIVETNSLYVQVTDEKTGKSFELDVPDNSKAMFYLVHAMAQTQEQPEARSLYASPEDYQPRPDDY